MLDKIKTPKNVAAVFGSSVHKALQFMFSRDPLYPTLDEVLSHFSEHWQNASKKTYPELTPELAATYEESGKAMLKRFFKNTPPWNFSTVDTESHFEILLPDPESNQTHILAGIIDRIDKIGDGEYEVIDYKTSRKLPDQQSVDRNLQLSLYHMALMKKWPHLEPAKIKLSLYFLKHNEKLTTQRNAEAIQETKEAVLKTLRSIGENMAKDSFPATPSALCSVCPYRPICPAWRHLYQKSQSPTLDEAALQRALQEYFAIKESEEKNSKRIKELQGVVRSYMDTNNIDRVFDDRGYFIARRLQQRFKYNFDKIKEILLGAGLTDKWQMILEADEKKLKLIMQELPPHIRTQIAEQKILSKEFTTLVASTKPVKKE